MKMFKKKICGKQKIIKKYFILCYCNGWLYKVHNDKENLTETLYLTILTITEKHYWVNSNENEQWTEETKGNQQN